MTLVVTDIVMVAVCNDITTNFLVRMVILVTKVTNVPVVTFATMVNQGYHCVFVAMIT
jgi:hypothetical protein